MRLKLLPILFFLSCTQFTFADGYIYLSNKTPLFFISKDNVYSPDGTQLQYFIKGNIFFTGETDEKQNIFLLATSMDINSEKTQMIYEKDNRAPSYTFSDGKWYLGNPQSEDIKAQSELLHVEKSGKWMAFYSSITDSLLAYYLADSLPHFSAVLTAYSVMVKYKLSEKLADQKAAGPFTQNTYSTIKPIWGNVTANEWLWDGHTLRPRWNVDPRLVWSFDGQILKQQYESNIYEQYEWDGETFKPLWRTNRAQEWSWDGRIMKPTWDTDWANQYTIDDGVVKPWSNVHPEKEWHTDGAIPVPVIILVISGIARTY